jgi:acyl-homoserine lactone acylase PvdQ
MSRYPRRRLIPLLAVACVLALPGALPAGATPAGTAGPSYASNDYCLGACDDILPPGENGNATLADILANKALGTRPAHTADQLGPYANLVNGYQQLTDSTIGQYYDDASFGVASGQVASTIQPRSDVTITRDRATGVPHITGTTRSGTEYGAGYAAGQDRLWLMDLFRHVGRGQLTTFAGGAAGNRALEQAFWQAAPYTEADLQAQVNRIAAAGTRGAQAMQDINDYIAGLNAYLTQAYDNRTFPGEYDLTGHIDPITNAGTIDPFKPTDLVAIASVIGALFGSGGGGEVAEALAKQAYDARYGVTQGDKIWQAFREQNDPEAVLTVHDGQSFPYAKSPANAPSVAMPDAGSVTAQQLVYDPTGSATTAVTPDLPRQGMSNALVVSGQYTDDGHPVAVFGPQTGYYAPQLLMLEELQGPGISARGAAFAGESFYVELGRGQDYSWSATSAGQDITDTFAVPLCEANGGTPTKNSMSYLYHGQCLAMEPLEVDDSWSPTTADSTAAGSYKLIVYRTRYGLVRYRGTVAGKPVAFASLRSSYRHEADSIIGFQEFNDPGYVHSAATFQQAAADVNYTFNWFYVDSAHTAYFNSGSNPVRPSTVDPDLPVTAAAQYEWQGWDPATNAATYTPTSQHPQSVDQDYYVSWNNKQALDYSSAGPGDGPVYRVNLLDSRIKALVHSGHPVSRADVVKAMEESANTDLRGEDVLPLALQVIDSTPVTDPTQAAAVTALAQWQQAGSHRLTTTASSHTYSYADAIRIMDAWWPLLMQAEFQPGLGDAAFTAMLGTLQLNESPSGGQTGPTSGSADVNESQGHKGSSFQFGWWSLASKDLRSVLGQPVSGPLGATYCGGGNLSACRTALLSSLAQAAAEPASQVYPGDSYCSAGDQWCADSIVQQPLGGITDPTISWQNRPTYQQVVQFQSHR